MHPNEKLLTQGYEAFAAGDMATLDGLIADDVVWVSEHAGVLTGRFESKAALFENWAKLGAETDGTFSQTVHRIFTDDHVAVVTTSNSATRNGKTLSGDSVAVFVMKDGKVTEGRVIDADPAANDAFWS